MSAKIWSTPCLKCGEDIAEGQTVLLVKLEVKWASDDYGTIHHVCPVIVAELERILEKFPKRLGDAPVLDDAQVTAKAPRSRLKRALLRLSGPVPNWLRWLRRKYDGFFYALVPEKDRRCTTRPVRLVKRR